MLNHLLQFVPVIIASWDAGWYQHSFFINEALINLLTPVANRK